ncbi:MAG: sulfite exporter TauE/SafE family protein [bacterium]|nr:sulfite exporter TauE/SafE family protein [bacterium]
MIMPDFQFDNSAGIAAMVLAVFIASLTGSPHCAGMCGGFVAFISGRSEIPGRAGSRPMAHFSYHIGRMLSYVILGVIAGLLGKALDNVALLAGLQRASALIAGVLMISWGIGGLFLRHRFSASGPNFLLKKLAALYHRLMKAGNTGESTSRANWTLRAFSIGGLSGLMPCGFLHIFTLAAATTASPLKGAMVMLAFWLGTVPMLGLVGAGSEFFVKKLGRFVPVATSVMLVLAGFAALNMHGWGGTGVPPKSGMKGGSCPYHSS